jgi:molybdopterin converting factor small subunit
VEIYLPPNLQPLVENSQSVRVDGHTVGECLNDLIKRFPRLNGLIFDRRGKLNTGLSAYLNGTSAHVDQLSSPVRDGDKIYIINLLVGG